MDKAVVVVALLGSLLLVARGLPGRQWPVIIAIMLALVILVVGAERYGYWPESWRVR